MSEEPPIARDLIDLAPPSERALLVGAPVKRSSERHHVEEHLQELARLADTAGAEVIGSLTQALDRPHPATYLGKGKVDELRQLASDREATLVIFDDELSPAQGRNIEQALNVRVMDRAELILDIFATRARSNEAKMQVELAQLEYMLPRLTRMWTHLEKFRGGIGMRGPGETQLETDRRLVNQRIKVLKERLQDVQRSREVQRSARRREFRAALVGYTNAGKSSILRALSNAPEVFVEDRLFATLDPLTREAELAEGARVLVTDTVGFIRKLPHDLVASFRATLEESREADLLLHVIDASHPQWEEQRGVVEEVLAEIDVQDTPVLYVYNKVDALDPATIDALRERARNEGSDAVFVSAIAPDGLRELRERLTAEAGRLRPVMELRIPAADGRMLASLYQTAEVLGTAPDDDAVRVRVRVDRHLARELEHLVADRPAGANGAGRAAGNGVPGAQALP